MEKVTLHCTLVMHFNQALILEVLSDRFRSRHDVKSSSGSCPHALSLGNSVVPETPKGCWRLHTCSHIRVRYNTHQCFPFGKAKKYSGEHTQARREEVEHFKPQSLSRWPLLVTSDFVPSQTNTEFQMESSYPQVQGNRLTTDVWGTVTRLLQKQPYLVKNVLFHSFFLCTLSAKTVCTVSISNWKANMSCNRALQLCFLHVSQSTFKGREILLFLFKMDGSYFTAVVTAPRGPLRQQ